MSTFRWFLVASIIFLGLSILVWSRRTNQNEIKIIPPSFLEPVENCFKSCKPFVLNTFLTPEIDANAMKEIFQMADSYCYKECINDPSRVEYFREEVLKSLYNE